jgi:hypothetical protein
LALAGLVFACEGDVGDAGTAGPGSGGNNAGGSGGLFNTGGGFGMGLQLDPPSATILVDNGVSSPVQFTASRGGEQVFPNSWSVDFGTIATVDNEGLVTATNNKGGLVTVTAEYQGITGSAQIEVTFKKTSNPAGISTADQDLLRNATNPDAAITWAYPYNETVWPQKLLAPEMMWDGGGAGDVYYVHFTGAYVDLEIFTSADPPSRYQIEQPDWIAINESGSGTNGAVDVRVARLTTGAPEALVVIDHDWKMSRGSLKGQVYYWANNLGRIVRIKPGQDLPEDFLAAAGVVSPDPYPAGECTACHTVSADGLTLVIGGDVGFNVFNLLSNQAELGLGSVGKAVRNWAMPAVSPDGMFVVENNSNPQLPGPPGGADGLWYARGAMAGTKVAGSGLDGILLGMPAFSPLGHKLAYIDRTTNDLAVLDFNLATGQASNPQTLVAAGGDPALNGICFPNLSPTLKKGEGAPQTFIVYHRGSYAGSYDTRTGPGHLYLASADTPGLEWRLEKINGDSYPFAAGDRDRGFNYEPTFAPQASGGYMWVVFTSRRTYGNRLTGGSNQVKQLWVAAIDPFPTPGTDPSHPAIWVRGQDPATLNMRGYWALDPCVQSGNSCVTDDDCCDGSACMDGMCGGGEECSPAGGECVTDDDCCDPELECIAGICDTEGPQ